jgi:thiamine-phosphate pyrophosphorylase
MPPLSDCRLYTFVDAAYLHGRPPADVARQLCDGGADLIQLRAKTRAPDEIRRIAETLLPVTKRAGVWLVINDHPQIAAELGAPLCHLGQEDFFDSGRSHVSELAAAAPGVGIGMSTHSPAQAERALAAGAEYIAIGPVYRTGTKPGARAVTLDYVRWAAGQVQIPWFAIGGITLHNLDDVLGAGARRVCVVSAILNAPDLVQACQQFKNRLLSANQ